MPESEVRLKLSHVVVFLVFVVFAWHLLTLEQSKICESIRRIEGQIGIYPLTDCGRGLR